MKGKLIFTILLFYVFIACKNETVKISTDEMRSILRKQNEKLEKYFKEGNAEKLSELYTDSAKLSPNGFDFIFGRQKIKEFWAEDFKTSKILEMHTNTLSISGNETVIYEIGKTTSKILYKDSIYNVTVKYVNVWKKQNDNTFKLDIDFWNKDAN